VVDVAAFLAGCLAIATITFVSWLIENDYGPSRDRHLFGATFLFPLLVDGIVSVAVIAPLLSPIYALSIIAIQKKLIRRRLTFIAPGTVFASMGRLVLSAYHCVISNYSPYRSHRSTTYRLRQRSN
jgi:hypothetical protein